MIEADQTPTALSGLRIGHSGSRRGGNLDRVTEELTRYLRRGEFGPVTEFFEEQELADTASILERLGPADALLGIRQLPLTDQAEVFGYLKPSLQIKLAEAMDRKQLAEVMGAMNHDERADLYKALEPAVREALLPGLAQVVRDDLRRLASYPEGTAGAVMTSDYATLRPEMTAPEALEALRQQALDSETVYSAYIVDIDHKLLGVLALRELLIARAQQTVGELMDGDPVAIVATADRDTAAQLIARYDLIALPVLDAEGRLVGIVTQDDAMDVAEEQATEDLYKASTVRPIEGTVSEVGFGTLYRARIYWLVLLVFGNIFSGAGIAAFEDTIADNMALLFFLPLLIGSGGNAGAQSATLMVRALAIGDVGPDDWGRMLGREFGIGLALGLTMALAVSPIGIFRAGWEVTQVVVVAMVIIVVMGAIVGMSLPFILSRFRMDPATASGPLVASICDVLGVLIYFGIATLLLSLA